MLQRNPPDTVARLRDNRDPQTTPAESLATLTD